MSRRSRVLVMSAAIALAAALVACEQQMTEQPSYRPLEESRFFPDGSSAQQPVAGTLPREAPPDEHAALGTVDGEPATDFPFEVTEEVIARGAARFAIFCVPCHGASGAGDGPVVRHGFPEPPRLDAEHVVAAPPGRLFQVITNGFGRMPSYAHLVPPRDRWAIVAFIQALQRAGAVGEALSAAGGANLDGGEGKEAPSVRREWNEGRGGHPGEARAYARPITSFVPLRTSGEVRTNGGGTANGEDRANGQRGSSGALVAPRSIPGAIAAPGATR